MAADFLPALLGRAGAKTTTVREAELRAGNLGQQKAEGERAECSGEGCLPTCLTNLGSIGLREAVIGFVQ